MKKACAWIVVICGTLAFCQQAAAETTVSAAVRSAFYPYSREPVHHEGITPGMTISQQNWQVAEKALPGEVLRLLQAGDFTITVQETTDLPAREAYVSATEQYASNVSLDGGYRVHSYQGGRPFPVIDPSDPRA